MLKKIAKVVHGEYIEWMENKGAAHPVTKNERTQEFQLELSSVQAGSIESKYNLFLTDSTGLRVA